MSLTAAYQQFLAAPNSSSLAPNASLLYVTTTTSFTGPTDIIKHLNTLRNQVKKQKEETLDAVEGRDALAIEIDTTLEFVTSGGTYLPGLDDNFLTDRTVYIPITHIVNFDGDGKISSIRQSWDQGSLLKQVEVIGRSGRSWPIRDSREQVKLITNALKAAGKAASAPTNTDDAMTRSRGNSQNVTRDPHASLSLFTSQEQKGHEASSHVVAPYAGNRPHQRSFTDILGEEDEAGNGGSGQFDSPSKSVAPKIGAGKNFAPSRLFDAEDDEANPAGREGAESPSKAAPKIGAGKNFAPSRLFDNDEGAPVESDDVEPSPSKYYRPHPKKYQHFDFADGSDPHDVEAAAAQAAKAANRTSKHESTWSFEDFVTPQKPRASKAFRHQDVRHWGADADVDQTPAGEKVIQKPRRDADTHFEFLDDGEPEGEPRPQGRPRGSTHNSELHLYENRLYNEDGSAPTPGPQKALGNITNLSDRRKDFDSHWHMTDEPSPEPSSRAQPKISEDRKKAVNMMNANWSSYDQSPEPPKENKPKDTKASDDRGINIAGDGMGGRKGTGRDFLYGGEDDVDDTPKPITRKTGRQPPEKDFWDF